MKATAPTGMIEREVDRRQFLKAVGAATLLGAAGSMGGGLLFGCGPQKAQQSVVPAAYRSLRMVGSSIGGVSTTSAIAYAAVFNKYYPEIEWSTCSGSTGTNPIYITKGTIQLGMLVPGNYVNAYGYDKIPESRLRSISLATSLSQYFFLIPEDKPWKDIVEVPKGLTLSPGKPGTAGVTACEAWLQLAGLSKKDFNWVPLDKGELADAWRAGKVDLSFTTVSGPEPSLIGMYTSPRKFKAMGLSPQQAAKAKAEQTFERLGFESPVMGSLSETCPELFKYDVVCPQIPTFLCSRDDFPEGIAYSMAKTIDEHSTQLSQIFAPMKYGTPQWHVKWAKPPCDIHSGVAKYYREKGYLR